MRLDTNYLRKLTYIDKSLKDIEIENVASEDEEADESEQSCGLGIKGSLPLTENALKNLCSYLKIPYPFTKQLRAQGRTNVLSYIQRQLSQAAQANVVLVCGAKSIISITDEEKLHYKGSELINIDKRIQDAVKESQLELVDVVCDKGSLNYLLFHKQKLYQGNKTKRIASSLKSTKVCEDAMDRILEKLEKQGMTCFEEENEYTQ